MAEVLRVSGELEVAEVKYYLIHHGTLHSFDEFEETNVAWITYICDGSRHGAARHLLSESVAGAREKYVAFCHERIRSNTEGCNAYIRKAQEQVGNIETWTRELINFAK